MSVPAAVSRMMAQWGRKGGRARSARLTPHARSKIAQQAAAARWAMARGDLYAYRGGRDLGEIGPKISGGSMAAWAGRESFRFLPNRTPESLFDAA